MLNRNLQVASAILAGSQFLVVDADAAVAASFSLPQTPCCGTLVNGVDGFDFTPTSNIIVTSLGWYDHGADGLNNSHPVGIYLTSTQQLVAPAATVTTSSPLDPATSFRFEPIAPLTLLANVRYTIVGYGAGPNWDLYVTNPSGGVSFNPSITYNGWRTATSSGLTFPTQTGGLVQQLFFAANFMLSPVPEPSVAILMTSGLFALVCLSAIRRQSFKRDLAEA